MNPRTTRLAAMLGCTLATSACANAGQASVAASSRPEAGVQMTDTVEIVQGRVFTHQDARMGLVSAVDGAPARLSIARGTGDDWVEKVALKAGDIFAVGGEFFRADAVRPASGDHRGTVVLSPFPAPAGMDAPAPANAIALEAGELALGSTALQVDGEVTANSAKIETWPRRDPRSNADHALVSAQTVAVGDEVHIGNQRLQVVRLQPRAGEIQGFVEFALIP